MKLRISRESPSVLGPSGLWMPRSKYPAIEEPKLDFPVSSGPRRHAVGKWLRQRLVRRKSLCNAWVVYRKCTYVLYARGQAETVPSLGEDIPSGDFQSFRQRHTLDIVVRGSIPTGDTKPHCYVTCYAHHDDYIVR